MSPPHMWRTVKKDLDMLGKTDEVPTDCNHRTKGERGIFVLSLGAVTSMSNSKSLIPYCTASYQ